MRCAIGESSSVKASPSLMNAMRMKRLAMLRRRELKGMVVGLLGSFVSRNNYVAGFGQSQAAQPRA